HSSRACACAGPGRPGVVERHPMATRSRIKTLKINGRDVSAREDETILDVAYENGVFIPTLCQIEGLTVSGACRLCLVEVAGWRRLVPACATHVEEGMEINTDTERLR